MTLPRYAKAIWAFLSTIVGALIIAVTTTPAHSLRDVGTLGWLTVAATVLGVTGGVYGWTNTAPPAGRMLATPTNDEIMRMMIGKMTRQDPTVAAHLLATASSLEATYTQTLAAVNAKLDRILAAVTGTTTPPISPPAPPTPPPTPTPTPTPTPVPPTPPADVQAVYWINKSQGDITDAECVSFVQAMNIQAVHLSDIWPSVEPVTHVFWTGDPALVPAAGWPMYFLPDADTAGALGWHSVDPHGRPYGRVFTRYQGKAWPALRPGPEGISISNIASHEGGEIQGDPSCAATATAPNGDVWALEDADPVEAFCYDITVPDGTVVSMSDLVGGAFFGQPGEVDLMGEAKPFTISPGGYGILNGKQVFADEPSLRYLSQQGSPAGRTARRLAAH